MKSKEEAAREKEARGRESNPGDSQAQDNTMGRPVEGERDGINEGIPPPRNNYAMRSPSTDRSAGATILPIVEEAAEGSLSRNGSGRGSGSGSDSGVEESTVLARQTPEREERGRHLKSHHDRPVQLLSSPMMQKYQERPDDISLRVATVS